MRKRQIGSAIGGAAATAAIPASLGFMNPKVLAGAAVLGAVGGFFGVDVAGKIRKAAAPQEPAK